MNLIGIDMAWQSGKNTSAAAVGELKGATLSIHALQEDLDSVDAIADFVSSYPEVAGLAIDAPLIINNVTGQRSCEKELSKIYGRRKASCHTSNLTLYPAASSIDLGIRLVRQGYSHLGSPQDLRWQVECYPHPAIIEMFGLDERLPYKKGKVDAKRRGQIRLAGLIRQLAASPVLSLSIDPCFDSYLEEFSIANKRGSALKKNEDTLDAIICTYIAGLYARNSASRTFGSADEGYIYVPQAYCL